MTSLLEAEMNLDFLQHIREVTGYILVGFVHVKKSFCHGNLLKKTFYFYILIMMKPKNLYLFFSYSEISLQIIRGHGLFKINFRRYGLAIVHSHFNSLELPNLREIIYGSVLISNISDLCFLGTINWEEIITGK